jgi:hypothetical protein
MLPETSSTRQTSADLFNVTARLRMVRSRRLVGSDPGGVPGLPTMLSPGTAGSRRTAAPAVSMIGRTPCDK